MDTGLSHFREFFDNWKDFSKWRYIKPYEEFAKLIERYWKGLRHTYRAENKVPLGLVEGLNNKIRSYNAGLMDYVMKSISD